MPAKGQRATTCKWGHPLTEDNRLHEPGRRGGGACRSCYLDRLDRGLSDAELERRAAADAGLKRCSACHLAKSHGEFNRSSYTSDGLYNQCRSCVKARKKQDRERDKERNRDRRLQAEFGLTGDQYAGLAESQHNACAICRRPCRTNRRLAVDHDHVTGQVRGLLCGSCNNGLGRFRDDPELLRSAAAYLEAHQCHGALLPLARSRDVLN